MTKNDDVLPVISYSKCNMGIYEYSFGLYSQCTRLISQHHVVLWLYV